MKESLLFFDSCLNEPDSAVRDFARVRKDSVPSPLFQLVLVTTSLVIFCQCIYLSLCTIRDFFPPTTLL